MDRREVGERRAETTLGGFAQSYSQLGCPPLSNRPGKYRRHRGRNGVTLLTESVHLVSSRFQPIIMFVCCSPMSMTIYMQCSPPFVLVSWFLSHELAAVYKMSRPCRFFGGPGGCRKENSCPFRHDIATTADDSSATSQPSMMNRVRAETRPNIHVPPGVCRIFAEKGECL